MTKGEHYAVIISTSEIISHSFCVKKYLCGWVIFNLFRYLKMLFKNLQIIY